jgi:UDP-N-acetylmuramate--alanine ligase
VIKPESTVSAPETLGNVHFVGIGGSGMSGIARLFVDAGLTVTGSDIRESHAVSQMRELGIPVGIGHDAANVGEADTLVVTGALWENNPEYVLARKRNLPILHRSRALEWLTRGHRLISVAGAHGKTTSTGMLVTGLREMGEDPNFVNGGVIQSYGLSADSGSGDLMVRSCCTARPLRSSPMLTPTTSITMGRARLLIRLLSILRMLPPNLLSSPVMTRELLP